MNKEIFINELAAHYKTEATATTNMLPRQQMIKALQGLSAKNLSLTVVFDAKLNLIKRLELYDTLTYQTTIIRLVNDK